MMWNGGEKMRKRIYHEKTELGPIAIYLRSRGRIGYVVAAAGLLAVSARLIWGMWV